MEAKLELNQRSLSVDIQLPRLYSNTIILNLNPRAEKKHTPITVIWSQLKCRLKQWLDSNLSMITDLKNTQPLIYSPLKLHQALKPITNDTHFFYSFDFINHKSIQRKRMKPQHSVKHVVVLEYVSKWMKSSAFYSVLRLIDLSGNWIILSLRAYRYPIQNHFNLI